MEVKKLLSPVQCSQLFPEVWAVSLFLTTQGDEGGAEQNPGHRDWITALTAEPSVVFKMGSLPRLGNCVKLSLTNESEVLEHAYRGIITIKACS